MGKAILGMDKKIFPEFLRFPKDLAEKFRFSETVDDRSYRQSFYFLVESDLIPESVDIDSTSLMPIMFNIRGEDGLVKVYLYKLQVSFINPVTGVSEYKIIYENEEVKRLIDKEMEKQGPIATEG